MILIDGVPYRIEFQHIKPANGRIETVCNVYDADSLLYTGAAYCGARDQYNRKVGNLIALGRAIPERGLRRKFLAAWRNRPACRKEAGRAAQ